MAHHPQIPVFSTALTDLVRMYVGLTKDHPVSLFWLDVNKASHLFGFRIRNQSAINGDVRITTELNAWLARLAAAAPPRLKLHGTNGDEVLVVDEGDPADVVEVVYALIKASEALPILSGRMVERTAITVACGGIRAHKGIDGYQCQAALSLGTKRAKTVAAQAGGDLRSAICWAPDGGSAWTDRVFDPPEAPEPVED